MVVAVGSRNRAHVRLATPGAIVAILAVSALLLVLPAAASAEATTLKGTVASGGRALEATPVKVYRAGGADGQITLLGRGVSNATGRFHLRYRDPADDEAVLYAIAGKGGEVRLAATLGLGSAKHRATLNELTTAATGYAFAQFVGGRRISGPSPGPENAALMARNLVNPRTGELGGVLRKSPNGGETSTLATFNSVANMLIRCGRDRSRCKRLFQLALTHDGRRPKGTLQAVANIAANPWQNVNRLFRLSASAPDPNEPSLDSNQRPTGWIMPLRFVGDGDSIDGAGNFAVDADGNVYMSNNYEYGADPLLPVCGSDLLPKFAPDGSYPENSPFEGGGLSGAGYGVTVDTDGNIWVANYGFAAPEPGCPADQQPPHNSLSKFSPDGTALSPPDGFVGAGISWPQGTISDPEGNIWVANCGTGRITRMPGGDLDSAISIDAGLSEAFDLVVNDNGTVFATGLGNDSLGVIERDGTPRADSPITDAGLDRPMGIALDSRGNMWIANSGLLDLPCPDQVENDFSHRRGSISLVAKGGKPVTGPHDVYRGGGLEIPWGIAVDGDDNVWVANFEGQRVSQFCGTRAWKCPPGTETGEPISPDDGYFFNGYVRITAVQIDPSGNVWSTNNWKLIPVQSNPGGYEVVILVGAAEPLRTPLIGPPEPLR